MKKVLIALAIWSAVLIFGFSIALVYFNNFLKNYQKTYDNTRPKLEMDARVSLFSVEKLDELMGYLEGVDLSTEDLKTQFKVAGEQILAGKTVAYDVLSGEHTEDRPAYVVTCDGEPVAVLRLQKQATAAEYGLPLWEIKNIEWKVPQKEGYTISAPVGVTLKVNGVVVKEDTAVETGIKHDRARYFEGYAEIPTYNKYSLDHIYGEPIIEATNAYGDTLKITLDEATKTYVVDFGTNETLKAEVKDYMIQFVSDYAQHVTNDTSYNYLDHYFPSGSSLLQAIKDNPRYNYDEHARPEVKNGQIKEFTVYDDDTVCARLYVEQHMYIYYDSTVKVVVTDVNVFFFKDGDKWKVSGIAFENVEE